MLYPAELHALKDLAYSTRKGVPVFGLLPSFAPIGYASLRKRSLARLGRMPRRRYYPGIILVCTPKSLLRYIYVRCLAVPFSTRRCLVRDQ